MATSIHAPQKETTGVPKTVQLCLQLDLASQRCLVTDCSISTATSTLAPLTSNSGKKRGLNTALIDVIWMTQNHKILMFFFHPWREKSNHRAGEIQIFTLESHACQSKWMSMLYTFFDDSCKYQHFLSYPQKWQFQIRHPYKGAESTGCLVFWRGDPSFPPDFFVEWLSSGPKLNQR